MKHGERPRNPAVAGWLWVAVRPASPDGVEGAQHAYQNHELELQVLSSVDVAEDSESGLALPSWHVSVVARRAPRFEPSVAADQEIELVRAAFHMGGAEEDNHGSGVARHLWLVCGRQRQSDCACKTDEERIVEGDRVRYETADRAGGAS